MRFSREDAEIFVPDGSEAREALARATHLCVAAHPDDVEVMALDGILQCFGRADRAFLAVILTDGAGSPREGVYGRYSDAEMRAVRRKEQKKAACVGEYAAVVFLNHSSNDLKDRLCPSPTEDLVTLLSRCRLQVVYAHNLADRHDTHVAAALRSIAAIRRMPREGRPSKLYGCEVWRDLDWLAEEDKVVFRLDEHPNIASALVAVFDSQIAGGKRYDLAVAGRRQAHATFHQSHSVDVSSLVSFAMDLTPLVANDGLDALGFAQDHIRRFAGDVSARIARLT